MYLTTVLLEVDQEDDKKKTNGGIVYKQILINRKLQIGKGGQKNRADCEKYIKEVRVRTGL